MKPTLVALMALFLSLPLVAADKDKPLPKDFKSLKALAEKGDAIAQANLGWMYEKGQGVEQDFKEAVKWYRKAAEQGDAGAQNNLGVMYFFGTFQGVKQNNVTAYAWWEIASTIGHQGAKKCLPQLARMMTPAQIAEAEELVEAALDRDPLREALRVVARQLQLLGQGLDTYSM